MHARIGPVRRTRLRPRRNRSNFLARRPPIASHRRGRLRVVDDIYDVVRRLDTEAIVRDRQRDHYGGVARVHRGFPGQVFAEHLGSARREVRILQTWIPNLQNFQQELEEAILRRRIRVRVLLLHPTSPVALLRDEALAGHREPAAEADVRESVEHYLDSSSASPGRPWSRPGRPRRRRPPSRARWSSSPTPGGPSTRICGC